jgi:hypothetical protein
MFVVPNGTSKVGTWVGIAVERTGASLVVVPVIVPVIVGVGRKAIVETNWGLLVGEAVGGRVLVGVGVREGVLLGVGDGPGVWVLVSVGIAVFVAGSDVFVGSGESVSSTATADGINVGVVSREATT